MANKPDQPLKLQEVLSYRNTNISTGVTTDFIAPTDYSLVAGTNTYQGSSNPDWRKQIAKQQDATTNYYTIRYSGNPCFSDMQSLTPTHGVRSRFLGRETANAMGMFNNADDIVLRDIALGRLKKKLNGMIGNLDTLVPAVELRELRKSIVGGAQLLNSTLQTLIDIKRTKGRSALKYASDAWLTFSFGVKPLLGDIKATNDAISSWVTRDDLNVRLSGTSNKAWTSTILYNNQNGPYRTVRSSRATCFHKLSYRYLGRFNAALRTGNNYGVDDHFGLELSALPSLAWELTPYSWAVDYFTTMGSYLDDTFVLPEGGVNYLVLCKRYEGSVELSSTCVPSDNLTTVIKNTCVPGFLNVVTFQRTKQALALPRTALRLKTVREIVGSDVDNILGVKTETVMNKILNLSSVLVQHVSGYKPDLPPKFRPPKWRNRHLLG